MHFYLSVFTFRHHNVSPQGLIYTDIFLYANLFGKRFVNSLIVSQSSRYWKWWNVIFGIEVKVRAIDIWLLAEGQGLCGDDTVLDNDTFGQKLARSENKMDWAELEELKKVDVRTVDVSALEDIEKIEIDSSLSARERWMDFAEKIKNPFCFICNGMVVKISYSEAKESLENKMVQLCMSMEGQGLC